MAQMIGYSGTLPSVFLHSASYPPAFAIALLNSFAVRCSGFSRRSRAIFARSPPYLFTRHSRYDLSPNDVCRSRTLADAASFSRSTGSVGELMQFCHVRRHYKCAAITRTSRACPDKTNLEWWYPPYLPNPLPSTLPYDHEPISAVLMSSPQRVCPSPGLVSRHVLPPHRHRLVVPRGQRCQPSLE